jgi:large subunit ribosomal protein L29
MSTYSDLQKLSEKDINKQIQEKRKALVQERFSMVTNQLKDIKTIQKTRREIARLLTALKSKGKGE